MIALPVMAVTACSSTDEATSAASGTESNDNFRSSESNVDTTVVTPIDANAQLSEQRA